MTAASFLWEQTTPSTINKLINLKKNIHLKSPENEQLAEINE